MRAEFTRKLNFTMLQIKGAKGTLSQLRINPMSEIEYQFMAEYNRTAMQIVALLDLQIITIEGFYTTHGNNKTNKRIKRRNEAWLRIKEDTATDEDYKIAFPNMGSFLRKTR